MKSKTASLFFTVVSFLGLVTFAPCAFAADNVQVTITRGAGAGESCSTTHNCFDPSQITISSGTTVEWVNSDKAPTHTVTSGKESDTNSGSLFDSGPIISGGNFNFTFNNPGTFDYHCQVHPWMAGQVIVDAAGGTMTGGTGSGSGTVPEFGPIASLILVIAVVSVIAVTAKTRGFLKL